MPGGGPPGGGPPGAAPGGGPPACGAPPPEAIAAGSATMVPPSGFTPPGGGPACGAGAPPGGGPPGGGPPGAPPGGGPPTAGAPAGGATPPGEGGATPSIVPFSWGLGLGAAAGAPAPGAPAPGAGAPPAAGAPPPPGRGTFGGAFIISIVPLNLGAAAPFKLKPHLVHVDAVSSFCVPQFGQNTLLTSVSAAQMVWRGPPAYTRSCQFLKCYRRLNVRLFAPSPPVCSQLPHPGTPQGLRTRPKNPREGGACALDTLVSASLRFAPPGPPGQAGSSSSQGIFSGQAERRRPPQTEPIWHSP